MTATGSDGIVVLGTEQQAAWGRRELPPIEKLPGGIWSVPVPIPDNPLRYTLSYLLPGDTGVVVVDPGWNDEETWSALLAGLEVAGFALDDVLGMVATHVHPDHHGLSLRLREATGAWVAMHPAEADNMPQRMGATTPEIRRRGMTQILKVSGASDEDIEELLTGGNPRSEPDFRMAEPDVLLEDGELVPLPGRRIRTVWTPGHTPGHICLADEDTKVLLTGDHVLPRISPNIGLNPSAEGAPLADFLASLQKVAGYDDHDALPAHEYRFRGLSARSAELIAHHEERCRELVAVVASLGQPTMWQIAVGLTWSRPWAEIGRMRFAALGETAAHVQHLVGRGELAWVAGEPGGAPRVRVDG
ncbi:MBL fold metallo-hydrolase [Cryptosporangium aurantiacum]|uniref:Glyoxylase, beta-lactamase superfamily II n=1 Tax=Cryptosporangium aurantiacum TaxID=134849 RepID=A0A1M7TU75_9ACTN|nr:MBL fold metallo-hydrolase [Cryptosporangium aurantiacum]SHN74265.1 Glyoxylase, beta-lactamase superfamily II [Cryptosporangium aurantiacum]